MFSYWSKKSIPSKVECKELAKKLSISENTLPTEVEMERQKMAQPTTDKHVLEFQDFLRRVQTLQMSHVEASEKQGLTVNWSNLRSSTAIEVGEEPPTIHATDNIGKACPSTDLSLSECENVPMATTNIRVTVGIDKDLEMILEMDPSIVDLGDISIAEATEPRIVGLPPLSGG